MKGDEISYLIPLKKKNIKARLLKEKWCQDYETKFRVFDYKNDSLSNIECKNIREKGKWES